MRSMLWAAMCVSIATGCADGPRKDIRYQSIECGSGDLAKVIGVTTWCYKIARPEGKTGLDLKVEVWRKDQNAQEIVSLRLRDLNQAGVDCVLGINHVGQELGNSEVVAFFISAGDKDNRTQERRTMNNPFKSRGLIGILKPQEVSDEALLLAAIGRDGRIASVPGKNDVELVLRCLFVD